MSYVQMLAQVLMPEPKGEEVLTQTKSKIKRRMSCQLRPVIVLSARCLLTRSWYDYKRV